MLPNVYYSPRYIAEKPATHDAFGRQRVSNIRTLFDSKQIHNAQALFWDDQETSGGGTGSTYTKAKAQSRLTVSNTTAGTRVRQTFQRFNYQPGKSQLVFLTFAEFDTTAGITKRLGFFDGNNGLFFQSQDGTVSAVQRSSTTGSPVNTEVAQSDWNIDTMDGAGASRLTLDFSKAQIAVLDFEWLGTGAVRMGWVVDGMIWYCHVFKNANNLDVVYMTTPNLPLRYEISNDGNGAAAGLVHICSSVNSEGGAEKTGILRHKDSGSVGALTAGTKYALIGLRLGAAYLDGVVEIENVSLISTSQNDQAHWELEFNPTVDDTFTYSAESNSVIETATGAVANTVTNGIEVDGGYVSTALPVTTTTPNALRLGSAIDGTVDTIVLTVTPITNNITVQASITWRELS